MHRDVFSVHLEPSSADGSSGEGDAPHRCPVTHVSCLVAPFSALVPCGHVLSDRALKELRDPGGGMACPVCSRPAAAEDVVPILGTEEQVTTLREALPGRRKRQQKKGNKQTDSRGSGCSTRGMGGGGCGSSNS